MSTRPASEPQGGHAAEQRAARGGREQEARHHIAGRRAHRPRLDEEQGQERK